MASVFPGSVYSPKIHRCVLLMTQLSICKDAFLLQFPFPSVTEACNNRDIFKWLELTMTSIGILITEEAIDVYDTAHPSHPLFCCVWPAEYPLPSFINRSFVTFLRLQAQQRRNTFSALILFSIEIL